MWVVTRVKGQCKLLLEGVWFMTIVTISSSCYPDVQVTGTLSCYPEVFRGQMCLSNLLAKPGPLSLWAYTGGEGTSVGMGDPAGPSIPVNLSPLHFPVAVSSMSAHTKRLQMLPRLRTKPGLGAKWSVPGAGAWS